MKTILLKEKLILAMILIATSFSQVYYAQSSSDENFEMQGFTLEFNSVNGPATSRTLELSFSESTSDDFDEGYDTKNLQLMQDDLNLLLNGEFFTAQAFSPITEEKIVDLALQASGSYNYTIELTDMENMGNQNLELRDNLTNTVFDLRSGEAYEFSSESGYFPNRFQITFKTTTLSQSDYEIENLDIRYVNNSNTISISNPTNIDVKGVEVFNISGQRVYTNTTLLNNSSISYNVNNLVSGVYIIRLVTESNTSLTKKVLVK
ncbi:T9SS type A sorting domain-containing protein [Winogradskyella tangerina]|uniref:T9SS type A sorting domain-containing protein n=1 Tax=Winogradskyella tangerina TaxID=2023240 RepID=UPI000DBE6DD5|nr:T9SS type A sorting domain-containing protein [Winogradskyella tangerina]